MNNFFPILQTHQKQQQKQKHYYTAITELGNSSEYKPWLSREDILDELNESV